MWWRGGSRSVRYKEVIGDIKNYRVKVDQADGAQLIQKLEEGQGQSGMRRSMVLILSNLGLTCQLIPWPLGYLWLWNIFVWTVLGVVQREGKYRYKNSEVPCVILLNAKDIVKFVHVQGLWTHPWTFWQIMSYQQHSLKREKNVWDSCCDNFWLVIVGLCEAVVTDLFLPTYAVCVWSISSSWGTDKGTERHLENGPHQRRGLYILFDESNTCTCINCKW